MDRNGLVRELSRYVNGVAASQLADVFLHWADREGLVRAGSIGTIADVAELSGSAKTTVCNWVARRDKNGFPAPIQQTASGNLFNLDEVREWLGRPSISTRG